MVIYLIIDWFILICGINLFFQRFYIHKAPKEGPQLVDVKYFELSNPISKDEFCGELTIEENKRTKTRLI